MWDIEEIKKDVKENLSEYRYKHSLRVMEEAQSLARHYNASEKEILKCMLCGLTHDLCKELSKEENEKIINNYNLSKTLLKEENKAILHGFLASIIVKEKYNFTLDMILAIRYHSTGYPNMDFLSKIVYLADKIEKKKTYPGILEERVLSYKNIDEAIVLCLKNQIKNLKEKNKMINNKTYETLCYLQKKL